MIYAIVLILSLVSGGYYYFQTMQDTIQQLRENNLVLESANKTNQETIGKLQESAELTRKLNEELTSKYNEAESKVDSLRDKLIGHDLTNLSLKKPGLIEKRINNGTSKAFANLESITVIDRVQPMADTGTDSGEGNKD
jgi:predicted Holliday junction resolvase-like endonuclease